MCMAALYEILSVENDVPSNIPVKLDLGFFVYFSTLSILRVMPLSAKMTGSRSLRIVYKSVSSASGSVEKSSKCVSSGRSPRIDL